MKDFLFSNVFYDSPTIMLLIDAQSGSIADSNEAARKFYGYSKEQFSITSVSDLNTLPREKVLELVKLIQSGKIRSATYQHKIRNGTIKDIRLLFFPVTIEERNLNLAIIEDITAAKELEDELHKFKTIADQSPAFIGMIDLNRKVLYMNQQMRSVFGVSATDDLSTYANVDFYSARGIEIMQTINTSVVANGYWIGENEMQTKSGKVIPVMQSIITVKDNDGKPLYHSMTAIDISKQKAAEQKILESEENLKLSEVVGKLGYFSYDLKSQLYSFSEGARILYGLKEEIVSREQVVSLRQPGYNEIADAAINKLILDKEPFEIDYQIKRKSDHCVVDIHVSAKYDQNRHVIFGAVKDISERKKWERQALKLHSELRSLNTRLQFLRTQERSDLAIQVHDKIGQQLVAQRFEIEQLLKKVSKEDVEVNARVGLLLSATKAMIKDFMGMYAEVKPVFLQHLPLADIIHEVCRNYESAENSTFQYSSDLGALKFNANIELSILKITENLLDNVIKHAHATTVLIDLRYQDDLLTLIVRDDGIGFRTADQHHGKFGFLEIRELIAPIGGTVKIQSQLKKGTTIEVCLPVLPHKIQG